MARTTYCTESDLLLGEMVIASTIPITKFLEDGANEIDSRIGRVYTTPILLADLTENGKTILRMANARLTSGRLLMAQAQAAQDDSLHSYAMYLLDEANEIISAIETNRTSLDGATVNPERVDTPAPSITNLDAASPIESFYAEFLGQPTSPLPVSPVWKPGS
jgi:hypothetical protein